MVKAVGLIKRKAGMTQEEFSRYWEKKHGPLVAKVFPGVKRYVQNHAVRRGGAGEMQVDGVAELWFADQKSWQAAVDFYRGDQGKVIRDDEEKFIDRTKLDIFVVEEKVILEI